MINRLSLMVFVLLNLTSASGQQTMFTQMASDKTGIRFNNQLTETPEMNVLIYQYLYNGGGVAAGDINNDGWCDVFFTGNMVEDKLYLNQGNFTFQDITTGAGISEPVGWSTGVTMADVNGDGFLDIYVCRSGQYSTRNRHNLLYINNGNNTFTEKAKEFGLDDSSFSTQASFFDMDADGDLDMFLLNHAVSQSTVYNVGDARSRRDQYAGNKLYRNDHGVFTDISETAGINGSPMTFGLGVMIGDINNDRYPDIFVTNDYQEQDFLYLNNKNGTFTQILNKALGHTSNFSMGCDMADINHDGLLDLIVMDMLPEDNYRQKLLKGPTKYDAYQMAADYGYFYQHMHNTLQLNNGDNTFSEIAWSAGVAATDWSWAPLFADYDLDGVQDLYITNGYRRDFTDLDFLKYTYGDEEQKAFAEKRSINTLDMVLKMPEVKVSNYMYRGGADIHFEKTTEVWGLNIPSFSNGAAYADLDNDGDLDIIVNNINDTAFIFRNNATDINAFHFLRIQIKGEKQNTFGIGTRVHVYAHGRKITRELMPARGYQSSVEPLLHFGLHDVSDVDVEVIFPSGKRSFLTGVKTDTTLVIDERSATHIMEYTFPQKDIFYDATSDILQYVHTEERYADFKREPLLLQKLSEEGPRMATGDINQDQIDDLFFCGGKNKKARLFLSSPEGYIPSFGGPWERDSAYEDTDALFFDADGDSDLDLYVTSGSNEYPALSRYYQDRLYLNAGNGTFFASANVIPVNYNCKSIVVGGDYDSDGDTDLFVGGSSIPGRYPGTAGSFLLENRNGYFTDVTASIAPALTQLGHVSDAVFTDIDQDGKSEFVISAQWQPITILQFRKGKCIASTLENSSGWWNCLTASDIDHDGDVDLIGGNRGTNHPVKTDQEHPVTIYNYDFDQNGSIDPIVTAQASDGKTYPVHSRDDLLEQINMLRKKYVYYRSFAPETLQDIFPDTDLSAIPQLQAEHMHSCVFRNNGNGQFTIEPLPAEAQWTSIQAAVPCDVNRDGHTDLLIAGNDFGMRPEHTRIDAGKGLVILNDGKGNFTTGTTLHISGEVKDMRVVKFGADQYLIVAKRGDKAQVLLIDN